MRDAEEAFGPAVATQGIEHETQRAVEREIDPEGGSPRGRSRLHAYEDVAAGERDQREPERLVELDGMPRPAVTAAGDEASDAADRVAEWNRDREVVRCSWTLAGYGWNPSR